MKERYPFLEIRCSPTTAYNCHGMTFASRRTGIYEPASVLAILKDDGYKAIDPDNVLPGDVIVYFAEDDQPDHSGVVVSRPEGVGALRHPRVCSKWGKLFEAVHSANVWPSAYKYFRYYRVML